MVHHGLGKSGRPAQSGKALALWSDRSAQILASYQHKYKHRINTNINSGSTQIADGSTKILIPDQHKYYQRINTNMRIQYWISTNLGAEKIWLLTWGDSWCYCRGGRYGIFQKNEYFHWMNNQKNFWMNIFLNEYSVFFLNEFFFEWIIFFFLNEYFWWMNNQVFF